MLLVIFTIVSLIFVGFLRCSHEGGKFEFAFANFSLFCKKFGVRILWVSAPCRLALAFQQFPLVFAKSSEMVLRFSLIAICTLWCSLMFLYEFIDFQMMFVDFRWCFAIFHWLPFISVYVVTTFVFILKNCN